MTQNDELRLIAPDLKRDAEGMFDLCAKVFSKGWGYYGGVGYMRSQYICKSHYDWNVSRIGLMDDRVVTHWGVWGYDMRVENALVRCGCIGAVATAEDVRKKRLMSRTARASLEAMREGGYDVSILFGIPDYYYRFGYHRAWSSVAYTVATRDLPTEKAEPKATKFAVRHRDDLADLYNRFDAGVTGTAVRPTFLGAIRKRGNVGYQWTDAKGRLAGYVVVRQSGHRLDVEEAIGDTETILRVLGDRARKMACDDVRLVSLPWETDLARRLRRGNCNFERNYRRNGGPLIAMLNLRSSLEKIAAVLSRRLGDSALASWRGTLLVADSSERVGLRIDRGNLRVADPGKTRHAIRMGDAAGRYLIGSEDPDEIAAVHGTRFSGDGRALCRVLFPDCKPMLREWDHA